MKPFDGWAVNVRCITDLDTNVLLITPVKGSSITLS